jgi:hypothetical protein
MTHSEIIPLDTSVRVAGSKKCVADHYFGDDRGDESAFIIRVGDVIEGLPEVNASISVATPL